MQLDLSVETARLIEQLMASGDFSTPAEVVAEAVALLHELRCSPSAVDPETGREWTQEELRAEIQKGLDDIAAGRVKPLDVEDIRRRGRERLAARVQAVPE